MQVPNSPYSKSPLFHPSCGFSPKIAHPRSSKLDYSDATKSLKSCSPSLFRRSSRQSCWQNCRPSRLRQSCAARRGGGDGRPQNDVVDFWGPTHVTTATTAGRRGRDEKKYGTATRDKPPIGRGWETSQGRLANKIRAIL